jgi:dihydrofolate reductase
MRRLIASEFVTLDGVIEAPGHEQHRDGKNAWALRVTSEEQQRFKAEELYAADALLLGRVTYQIFAAFWPSAPGDEDFAKGMNGIRKYVVSRTLREAQWSNTVILRGDIVDEVSKLKGQRGGDILVFGSADLVNSLMSQDLIDEYRLLVFPVVLGSGKRLFREESDTSHLRLVRSKAFSSGTVLLTYQRPARSPGASTRRRSPGRRSRSDRSRPHRIRSASWRRSCSRTSWIPRVGPPISVTGAGVRSWTATTGSPGRRSEGSAATS